ncbi:MAG: hypothetical protein RBQ91_03135 [Acholeplasma sp.]|nr:hypothetical protein [Acholeplasma sp.]
MLNKIKEKILLSVESYLILLGALVHFLFFFIFEFPKINVANPDMEIAGLTIVFRAFVLGFAIYLSAKLKDIANDNKAFSIALLVLALLSYIPSASRITNLVPLAIWAGTAVYIFIKYGVFEK